MTRTVYGTPRLFDGSLLLAPVLPCWYCEGKDPEGDPFTPGVHFGWACEACEERYNLQGRIAELEKTAYADVVEAVRKHHIAFHVELTRDGWIPRGFAECKDDRCASLARLDAPAKDRP